MTTTITLILGLFVATVVFAGLATRLRMPYAIVLVLGGLVLSFIPGLPRVDMEPDLVLLLFLPPLVYASAWQTSWRDFHANLRSILLLAIGLVLLTTVFVAAIAHLLLGFSWSMAFVLGAILSPTDTVAAGAIAQRVGLPKRVLTIIEGESLLNDATALVAYTFAVAAAVTGSFQPGDATLQFFLVSLGGLAVGLIIGWPVSKLHHAIDHPPIEITITLLTPFAAYLLAELVHVSGVLATLSAGLYLSRHSSRFFSSATRLQAYALWEVLVFLLNGLLFLLIGLQLRHILEASSRLEIFSVMVESLVVSLAVVAIRLAWVFAATYIPRFLLPQLRQNDPYPGWRNVLIVAWTGLRGGISLAVALALPLTLQNGQAFPERDRLIAITFGVILATLVGQGLSLIPLARWLGGPVEETFQQELDQARLVATQAALTHMQTVEGEDWVPQAVLEHLRTHYEETQLSLKEAREDIEEQDSVTSEGHQRLLRELVQAQRMAVIAMRNQGLIGDEVFRDIENELDLEEQSLSHLVHK